MSSYTMSSNYHGSGVAHRWSSGTNSVGRSTCELKVHVRLLSTSFAAFYRDQSSSIYSIGLHRRPNCLDWNSWSVASSICRWHAGLRLMPSCWYQCLLSATHCLYPCMLLPARCSRIDFSWITTLAYGKFCGVQ